VTRLTDLPPAQAERVAELERLDFETRPWATGPALSCSREVAQRLTPPGTALAAGVSSAAWGAFVFVFACPSDDPPLHFSCGTRSAARSRR
jgi:hypothetical protein